VNLFERLVAQKAVDDDNPWNLETHGLVARRFEHKTRLVSKFATQKGIDESLDILSWICNVSDGVECVGGLFPVISLYGTCVWALIRE
jgi:hypothetical protein